MMNFWGVEVKSGETFPVALGDERVLHLSQACLGESKNNKSESVCLHINVDGKKLVLGTLHSERLPQQLFDLVFEKAFTISHNWKNGSVFFYGYQADQPAESDSDDSEEDSDEEEEAIRLPIPNGIPEAKKEVKEAKKEEKPVAANKKDAKQVTIVEPKKDDEDDSDDSDSDDSDDSDSMNTDSGSDEGVGKDSDDSDDSDDSSDEEEEKEETPKKPQSGKKRQNESAMKTPTTDKKAKMSTPQKTDGKKASVHVATPHPSKKPDAKSAGSKSNPKSPASGGAHCKSCNRNFKTEGGLEAHNQAKHASK